MTRPTLVTYVAARADLEARSKSLFDIVKSGKVKIEISARYKLARRCAVPPRSGGAQDHRLGDPAALSVAGKLPSGFPTWLFRSIFLDDSISFFTFPSRFLDGHFFQGIRLFFF